MNGYLSKPVRREDLAAALALVAVPAEVVPAEVVPAGVVPAEVAPAGGEFDRTVLGPLLTRLGDRAPGFLTGLLATWESETASSMASFDAAVTEDDRVASGRLAHSIKGGSASMGAVELARVAGDIEAAARGVAPLDLAQARDRLAAAVARARVGLASLSA
ncbi:MAG: Hpt domain-containing protein [Frankiales bacterium]|nr:Hpt domain-containing protein [Frankiales bacterium]